MDQLRNEATSLSADVMGFLVDIVDYSPWAAFALAASPGIPSLFRGARKRAALLAFLGILDMLFVTSVYPHIGMLGWLALWVVSFLPTRRPTAVAAA